MPFSFTDPLIIKLTGLTGSLVVVLTSLAAGLLYRGRKGERYSPLNHFISELGEEGVSRLAWLFNAGLIAGGAVLLPCCIGLGLLIAGVWSKLGMLAGCAAAIAMALVGLFPMNNLKPHSLAAMTYFRAGLVMVILFTTAVALQPAGQAAVPRAVNWMGALAILAYGSFLVIMGRVAKKGSNALDPLEVVERPRFWTLPALEWSIFITTVLWFLAVGLAL